LVNQYLTFMATLYSIFYPTFNILIWQICEIAPIANLLVSISFTFVFLRKLNNSGFCPIAIPTRRDWISVFEIFLSSEGSIELPCLNLLPCQRKIVAVLTPT
jgi:hypothetical protein